NAFVDQLQFRREFRRNERCQRGEGERLVAKRFLPDATAMAIERAFGRDQGNFERLTGHNILPPVVAASYRRRAQASQAETRAEVLRVFGHSRSGACDALSEPALE